MHGKSARGWYAWKPVIIKQTLDMYDTVLYLDSGNTVLNSILPLFEYIKQNGSFFIASPHKIETG